MGASIVLIFFILLLEIGTAAIVCGIIGLVILNKKRRAGTPLPKVLGVIFPIVLSIGIATAAIPVTFLSYLVADGIMYSVMESEDFVQTDITIDEVGYQDEKFTANGVVYEVLDFTLTFEEDIASEPVFTYKGDGLFSASECGNYYSVENEQGFDLVSDGCETLFCPTTEKERVIEYYTDITRLNVYYDDWGECRYKLSSDEKQVVQKLLDTDIESLPEEKIVLEDAEEFGIEVVSRDKLLYVKNYEFLIFNKKLYAVTDYEYMDDYDCKYTMRKLPDDIADKILAIHQNTEEE